MLSLINKIGQRKTSKLLCGVTFLLSLVVQVLAYGAVYAGSFMLWMGCFLITLPNILLSVSSHLNKNYRLKCIYAQIVLVVLNFLVLLLVPQKFLLSIFVAEIILSAIVALVLYALPTPNPVRSSRSSSGSSRASSGSNSSGSSSSASRTPRSSSRTNSNEKNDQ